MCSEQFDNSVLGNELFLDTSIHVSRHKGEDFTQRISRVLYRFRWVGTCAYTKIEYGNVILEPAQYFLRKIKELGSLRRTLDFVGNVLGSQLHAQKRTWSFNLLLKHCGDDEQEATERAKLSLRALMSTGLAFVDQTTDTVADGMKCYWAKKPLSTRRGELCWEKPKCKKTNPRCKIHEFFIANLNHFEAIASAVRNLTPGQLTPQLSVFLLLIEKAKEDPQVLLDYKTGCKKLADALIAVESVVGGYSNFFTQNIKESHVLCSVFKQRLLYIPPNFEKGVAIHDFRQDPPVISTMP